MRTHPIQSLVCCTALWLGASPAAAGGVADDPAGSLAASARPESVRALLVDVLDRNPEIAAAEADARAALQRAPQVGALPDPMLGFTVFLQTPETRVGPQVAAASFSQRFPVPGTLDLRERASLAEAAEAAAHLAALRLEHLTAARELVAEVSFLDGSSRLLEEERDTLARFEEIARTRYATGLGTDQAVLRIQAEITRVEARLLELAASRTSLVARLNGLRDRVDGMPAPTVDLAVPALPQLDPGLLRHVALRHRPETAAARAAVEATEHRVAIAEKGFRPELSAGVAYTVVGRRDDAVVEDDGKDVLALTGGIALPVQRARREAAVEEAVLRRHGARERMRRTESAIVAEVEDLARRLPLIRERHELLDRVLVIQAEESLGSAVGAYSAGTAGVLDLLDAERVLLQVRTAELRARADLAVALARLEGAVAAPLEAVAASPPGGRPAVPTPSPHDGDDR